MVLINNCRIVWMMFSVLLVSVQGEEISPSSKTDGPSKCSSAMTEVLESAYYDGVEWAVEMVDASFKLPVGITRLGFRSMFMLEQVPMGSLQFLGNFDQCLEVKPPEDLGTLYCRVHVQIESVRNISFSPPKNLYADICALDLCEGDDLVPFAQKYLKQVTDVKASVQGATCQQKIRPYTYKAIVTLWFLSLLLVIVVMATVYDVVVINDSLAMFRDAGSTTTSSTTTAATTATNGNTVTARNGLKGSEDDDDKDQKVKKVPSKPGTIGQLLLPFSLYTNIPELMSTNVPDGSITSINGIRCLSALWILQGHFLIMGEPAMENVMSYFKKADSTWIYQMARFFTLGVDTFLAISGLLLTQKMLRELETRKPTLSYFKGLFFHRYMRLTVAYFLIMVTHVSLFKYISDGPFWPQGDVEHDECESTWWTNLLYINNNGHPQEMCMVWSWSLSLDMQFFVMSPLMLLPLYYFNWRGLIVTVSMLLASVLYAAGVSYFYQLPPNPTMDEEHLIEYAVFYYFNSKARIATYLVGIIAGFILYKTDCKTKLSKRVVIAGWTLSTIVVVVVLFFLFGHLNGNRLSNEMSSLYNALHRSLFAMSVCWVIFACTRGYGGVVNSFLSWKLFVPLSSLSYCVYLIQVDVIRHFLLSQRRMFYMDNINIAYSFIGVVVVTYAVSAVAYLLFEVSFAKLHKAIRRILENRSKLHQR